MHALVLSSGLVPYDISTKILYKFFITTMFSTCLAHLILLDLITVMILAKCANYDAHHYKAFSVLLSLPLSYAQIFSSALSSQTSAVCVLPLIQKTKCHFHTKRQANYRFVYSNPCAFRHHSGRQRFRTEQQ